MLNTDQLTWWSDALRALLLGRQVLVIENRESQLLPRVYPQGKVNVILDNYNGKNIILKLNGKLYPNLGELKIDADARTVHATYQDNLVLSHSFVAIDEPYRADYGKHEIWKRLEAQQLKLAFHTPEAPKVSDLCLTQGSLFKLTW